MVYYSKDNHQIFASTYNILSIIVSAQHLLCLINEKFDKETVWGLRLQSKIEIWFGRHEEGSWHKKWSCPRWAVKVAWRFFFIQVLQSGASNFAKHGGAYFLAVGGVYKRPTCCSRTLWDPRMLQLSLQLQQNSLVHMVLVAGFSNGFPLLRTRRICQRTRGKSDHPHQREPWCFVEVVN